MAPSVVNCLPMAPSLSSGPPMLCAAPPRAPWSVLRVRMYPLQKKRGGIPTGELLPDRTLLVEHLGLRLAEPGRGTCFDVGGHAAIAGGGFGCHNLFLGLFSSLLSRWMSCRVDDLHARDL